MKIKCKLSGNQCPKGFDICCATCEFMDTCEDACVHADGTPADPNTCKEAEIINDELTQFQSAVPDTLHKIKNVLRLKKEMEAREKELKQQLVEAMEFYGIKSFKSDVLELTYVAPTTRSTIDSARLKKEHPDLAEQYSKTSNVAASVRVTLK